MRGDSPGNPIRWRLFLPVPPERVFDALTTDLVTRDHATPYNRHITLRSGRLDLDLATGVFVAGPGIAATRRVAFFWRPQLRVYF